MQYASFDVAVTMVVKKLGKGALLVNCAIKCALCLLPVHSIDYDLLGFSFEGAFYDGKSLPMGCSRSWHSFGIVSHLFRMVLANLGWQWQHYALCR